MSAAERRGAPPHPAQLAALLLRRAVGHTAQHLVQQGECTLKGMANIPVVVKVELAGCFLGCLMGISTLRACG